MSVEPFESNWKTLSKDHLKKSLNSKPNRQSRPKSLEMETQYSSGAVKDSCLFYRHSADFSDKTLALIFVSFQHSKTFKYKRTPRDKKTTCKRVNGAIIRPLTWGPTGSKSFEGVELFTDQNYSFLDNIKSHFSSPKSPEMLEDFVNNNIENLLEPDAIPRKCEVPATQTIPSVNIEFAHPTVEANEQTDTTVETKNRDLLSCDTERLVLDEQRSGSSDASVLSVPHCLYTIDRYSRELNEEELAVRDVVVDVVNKVTWNEALQKSESIFKANEERLKQDLLRKRNEDAENINSILLEIVNKVVQMEATGASTDSIDGNSLVNTPAQIDETAAGVLERIIEKVSFITDFVNSPNEVQVTSCVATLENLENSDDSSNVSDHTAQSDTFESVDFATLNSVDTCSENQSVDSFALSSHGSSHDMHEQLCTDDLIMKSEPSISPDKQNAADSSLDRDQEQFSSLSLSSYTDADFESEGSVGDDDSTQESSCSGSFDIPEDISTDDQQEPEFGPVFVNTAQHNDTAVSSTTTMHDISPRLNNSINEASTCATPQYAKTNEAAKQVIKASVSIAFPNDSDSSVQLLRSSASRLSISDLFDETFTHQFVYVKSSDDDDEADVTILDDRQGKKLFHAVDFFNGSSAHANDDSTIESCVNDTKNLENNHVSSELNSTVTIETVLSRIVVNHTLQGVVENSSLINDSSNDISSTPNKKSIPQSAEVIKRRLVKSNSLAQLYDRTKAVLSASRVQLHRLRSKSATADMLNHTIPEPKGIAALNVVKDQDSFRSNKNFEISETGGSKLSGDVGVIVSSMKTKITDPLVVNTKENVITPKRPTSLLFGKKHPDHLRNSTIFDFLKDLSPSNLTPAREHSRGADVFSEATERVLEENKSIRRQASFTKRPPPVKYRRQKKLGDVAEQRQPEIDDENADSDSGGDCRNKESIFRKVELRSRAPGPTCHCYEQTASANDMLPYKSRSLPLNLKPPDYSSFKSFVPANGILEEAGKPDIRNATPTASSFPVDFLRVDEDRRRRDSALSRESAASSSTVVASDDEVAEFNQENKDTVSYLRSSPIKVPKSASSADAVFCKTDVADGLAPLRKPPHMERSHSLDRQAHYGRYKLLRFPRFNSPPVFHQANCGMMISAPTITVTHECNGEYRRNNISNPMFDPIMSSSQSLASSSYLGDESDAVGSSSRGSSAPSSPTGSPRLSRFTKTKFKSKTLRDNKHVEGQAADALEWLKAAGFPQYAHLYEVGNFPVDIASVSGDHDFLGQEHIAALVRRLNVLNKCANLKLDRTASREPLTDNEEDEYEQCAISEFWHLEEDGHRWSRMDSKASSVGTPTSRLSSSAGATRDGVREDSNGDVFASEGSMRVTSEDNHTSDSKHQQRLPQKQWMLPGNDDGGKPTHKVFKSKGNSFFKKFGSSFRKKEHMDRTTSMEGDIDSESVRSSKFRNDGRLKGWRKGRKPVIGEPVLQSGQDRFDQMKCVPLDGPASATKELQNQHRGRKNSSHSLISSSSSSGGASTASTPAFRTRASTDEFSDMGEISPGIHGRNRAILEMNISGTNVTLRNRETQQDRENSFYVIPRCYKPGTFPPTLREKSEQDELLASFPFPSASSTRSLSTSDSNQPASLQEAPKKLSRPMSIYDNLPDTALNGNASARDIINILDPGSPYGGVDDSGVYEGSMESLEPVVSGLDAAFWSVDDIVEHTQCLQQMVGSWDEEESADDRVDSIESNQADCLFPASAEVLPSYSSENISTAEDDAELNALPHGEHRTNCRLRWEVSNKEGANNMKHCEECLQLHTLSVGQLMILRRLSMLKLTALMESYAFSNNKGTLSWSVPRFIRRMKVPDYKDKSVFGVPLLQNVQRFGQPLPQCIQHALGHLRRTALDQVGLFRKPGVRSRIQKLRGRCESNPDLKNFDDCSAFDVADMVKQYFRELPDPLMTMKMSETFIGIFLYVPQDVRLQALQAATMLLPDETRETLKTLLLFLAEVASKSDENHMTASNLSTCFSPSLFYQQLNSARLMGSVATPKVRKSQGGKMAGIPLGKPDMNENKAANQCLGFMIRHVRELFKISEDAMTQCRMSVMQQTEDVLATEIGYTSDHHDEADYYTDFHSYVDRMVAQTIREEQRISQNKGGWQNIPSAPGSELMCKKINDGNPLRLWRSQVEATGADPNQIMDRILNERHLWDEDLLQWKVLQQPDERTQLFQIVQAEMSPHPTRDYCVLRSWRNGANSRGAVVVVETSTGMQALLGDVRGVILTSRYVIEPTDVPNKCTLTHVCRVDTKGRNPEWYNKAYGHIVTQRLLKIRDSIQMVPPKSQSFVG